MTLTWRGRQRRGGHLHERAAAVVDGELGHDARDRALAHLAGCAACRAEVDLQRRVKRQLHALTDPRLPAELTERLLALAVPPPARPAPAARPVTGSSRPSARVDPSRPRPGGHGRAARVTAVGVLSGALASVVAALAIGGTQPAQGPAVTPPVGSFVDEHAALTDTVPLPSAGVGSAVTVALVGAGGR